MKISLEELLESRENRQNRQNNLINMYGQPLISLTIVMPGAIKKNKLTSVIALRAKEIIKKEFNLCLITEFEYDLKTGFEAIYVISMDEKKAKEITCEIEEKHPWGRLFDIDVIGINKKPVSREQINRSPRKCLICEKEARICTRSSNHRPNEILTVIENIVNKQRICFRI